MYILAPGVESRQPFKYGNRGFAKEAKNGQQNIYTENMENRRCRNKREKESEGDEDSGIIRKRAASRRKYLYNNFITETIDSNYDLHEQYFSYSLVNSPLV